jgi:3D (Asp-Asp-Asp) domain-containing protein
LRRYTVTGQFNLKRRRFRQTGTITDTGSAGNKVDLFMEKGKYSGVGRVFTVYYNDRKNIII